MGDMIPIVWEEITFVDGPFKFGLLLLFLYCLKVVVYCAVEEIELPSILMIHKDLCCIIKESIVDISELPSKIHTCCNHNLICLVMASISVEAT